MKRVFVIVFLFLLFVSLFLAVQAQPDSGLGEFGDDVEKIQGGVDAGQDFLEEERWKYLSQEWREALLANPIISAVDSLFKKVNWLFVFLFGQSYALSLTLLIVVIMWLEVFFTFFGYMFFVKSFWSKAGLSAVVSILLAHVQVYNYLSLAIFKVVFYRVEWYWKTISLVVIAGLFGVFLLVNIKFSSILEEIKKTKEYNELKQEVSFGKKTFEAVKRSAGKS